MGETISGIQRQHSTGHQMNPGVSAYVRAGDPSSGLLPGVEPDVAEPGGSVEAALAEARAAGGPATIRLAGGVYPRTGEDPSSPGFIAVGARLRELVTLTADPVRDRRHVANVTFRNIRFADADADLSDEDPVNAAQGSAHIGAALVLRGAKQCRFEDCAFEALEGFAVDVRAGSRENVFSRCRFSGLGGGAVRIDGGTMDAHPSALTRGNVITDCEIGDYGLDWASACGILVKHAAENVIAHNRTTLGTGPAVPSWLAVRRCGDRPRRFLWTGPAVSWGQAPPFQGHVLGTGPAVSGWLAVRRWGQAPAPPPEP